MPTIKKYENRRLYDSEASRYVNLDDIAAMVRRGEAVSVQDARTGRDLTRETLLQVLLAAEGGADLLPLGMLRRVIRATGDDPLQRMMRPHLANALELMHTQLDELESRMVRSFPHLAAGAAGSSPPPFPGVPNPFAGGANPFAGHAPFPGVPNPFAGVPNPFAGAGSPAPEPPADLNDPPPTAPPEGPDPGSPPDDGLDALRRRLEELEARLRR